jgi:predicted DNA-binding transcriptional regulator AlpA
MPRTESTTPRGRQFTAEDIAALPPMLDLTTTAGLLGISRATAYRLAADNDLPVPVQRVGHSLRVPTAPLLALLGLTPAPTPDTADSADDDRAARAGGADPAAGAGFGGRTGAGDQDARPDRLPAPDRSGIDGKTPTR